MIASSCTYESLAVKDSFNASVRHVKATIGLAERVSSGENLADALNALIDEKVLAADGIRPIVSLLLTNKFTYHSVSRNLCSATTDMAQIQAVVKSWNAFDIVVIYNHPDLGVMAINPKNPAHVARIDRMNKTELLVAYVGCFGKSYDAGLAMKVADAVVSMYEGGKPKENPAFLKGSCSYKVPVESRPAKAEKKEKTMKVAKTVPASKANSKGKPGVKANAAQVEVPSPIAVVVPQKAPVGPKPGSRMTPMYSVNVTNELFHNGNVEAWKRIIDSYKAKHQGLDVLVYYDGERIVNLNALFKWGKVKHGSAIQFAVAGEAICDVAKLQRYLAQGASPMFEAFLRGPVNGVLSLF